ncbi:MAG TPA: hypothetical protein VK966_01070 [Longimicrobiales bacterium]|nr:hypothetical protein [Longimicrobiales bacterium]
MKPKIFAFVNGGGGPGQDVLCVALAEDGTHLASHVCSSPAYGPHDMGADGRSDWKHERYAEHYPDGYEVEWVSDPGAHEGARTAIALNQTRRRLVEP